MAWTNMNAGASGEMAIVSKGQWAANDLPYELTETPGGVIFWQFYDNGGRDTCSPNSPPVGEWHHIAGEHTMETSLNATLMVIWEKSGHMRERCQRTQLQLPSGKEARPRNASLMV